ncbi:MAG TPA: exosortase A [Rhizomicrobium sp.]|nr:exosortase A [Rhizomicrobium sp.]
MTVIALPATGQASARAWLRHGAALAILLFLLLLAFRQSITAAVTVWYVSPTYSHCFLILPIVLWLVWEKRAALGATAPGLMPLALLAMPLLGLVWWMGELAAINEVQQFAVVGLAQAAILALLGVPVVRLIWFPVLYLLFLVPTGEYLILPMQHFATRFVDVSLNLLNIPHYTEGTTFELTNGRFEIAEACAGLRFLIATVTLGVLFSYMMFRKIIKTVLFLLACVAVPLIGNGLRCVGIIMLAHFTNNEFGAGADHIVYGWGFNIAILVILGLLGSLFRDDFHETADVRPSLPVPPQRLTLVAAAAAGLLVSAPALAWWHDNYFVASDLAVLNQPFNHAGWRDTPAASWHPEFSGLDAQSRKSMTRRDDPFDAPVDFFLGYYARPRPGHSMTAHVNRFWNAGWTQSDGNNLTATLAGKRIQIQEWIISTPVQKRLVWSSYWVDGRFTTSLFKVKLLQAAAALQGHEGQAVFAVSTVMEGAPDEARLRLFRALSDQGQLPALLAQANRRAASRGEGGR